MRVVFFGYIINPTLAECGNRLYALSVFEIASIKLGCMGNNHPSVEITTKTNVRYVVVDDEIKFEL